MFSVPPDTEIVIKFINGPVRLIILNYSLNKISTCSTKTYVNKFCPFLFRVCVCMASSVASSSHFNYVKT